MWRETVKHGSVRREGESPSTYSTVTHRTSSHEPLNVVIWLLLHYHFDSLLSYFDNNNWAGLKIGWQQNALKCAEFELLLWLIVDDSFDGDFKLRRTVAVLLWTTYWLWGISLRTMIIPYLYYARVNKSRGESRTSANSVVLLMCKRENKLSDNNFGA